MPTPDPLSFTAPSHVKVLLAPVGRIKRAKFYEFVDRLRAVNKVRLEDVSLDSRGTRTTFSPLSFPNGQIIYCLNTSYNTEHEYLDGLEMHRRTYMVIAVADFMERNSVADLRAGIQDLVLQYPKSLLFPLVMFDTPIGDDLFSRDTHLWKEDGELSSNVAEYPKLTIPIPSKYESSRTSIRAVMSDLSSLLLYEFAGLSKSLQALPTIEAPAPNNDDRPPRTSSRMSLPISSLPANAAQFANLGGVGNRLSMAGFGSGSLSERERVKGKIRINIAIANLHLMAGLVTDAFRQFTEGAIAAKTNADFLWHGKALEGIGVSLIIMAQMGLDLQVPTVIFPATTPLAETKWKLNGAVNETLESVFAMLPELLNTILGLYARAATFNNEFAPPLVQSETIIRFCKLMVIARQYHGLNPNSLAHIVLGTPVPVDLGQPAMKNLARSDIATLVMKAYPPNLERLTVVDAASILGGMAAVLDKIGFKRKKALVTRELLKLLVPSLIQARVVGAAETGLHPTASGGEEYRPASRTSSRPGSPGPQGDEGDSALDGDEADIVRTSRLLDDLCAAYGITHDTLTTALEASTDDEKNTLMKRGLADLNYSKGFGWLSLKVGVLRSCILLTEAIPDYEAILRYTTKLLEIAGTELTKGEQGKLAESFTKTVGLARKSGLDEDMGGVADYWDDYLLRDVELVESQIWKPPVPRAANELSGGGGGGTISSKTPFIYNPFASKHTTITSLADTTIKTLLVESEPVDFLITLQNPFDFEIQIDSVALEVTGVKFETLPASLVIGAYRQHTYVITGIPQSSGAMKMLGAKIRVYGCKERFFPIIPDLRMIPIDGEDKIKQVGLGSKSADQSRPKSHLSTLSNSKTAVRASQIPAPNFGPDLKQLSINVIPAQPKVIITHTSLPQNAVMVLEGEKQVFTVHIKNESDSVAVNFLAVSFVDSTTEPVTNAIAQKQGLPAEVYELEIILYKKKAFEWVQPDENFTIPPGGRGSFQVQVLGKPGLTNGTVVVDYGYINRDTKGESPNGEVSESSGRWYTRRTETDITVTVNAAVELVRMDFLPWSGVSSSLLALQHAVDAGVHENNNNDNGGLTNGNGIKRVNSVALTVASKLAARNEQVRELFDRLSSVPNPSTYALVLIDIRNSWPHPLRVSMGYNPAVEDIEHDGFSHGSEEDDMRFTASDTIPAGHSTRLILPLKRIYVANPTAPIPSLSKTQRQYVVSMTKVSPEIERVTREGFWYKEAVLGRISGCWEEVGSDREGVVECRNFRMSGGRGVDVVKAEEVDVQVGLAGDGVDAEVNNIARGRWGVKTDGFFKVRVVIKNRGAKKLRLISRLLPCLRFIGGGGGNPGLEMMRRAGFNGTLQKSLGWLKGGEERVVEMGMVVIASGEYEILGCVEEVKGDDYDEEEADEGKKVNGEPLEVEQRLLEDMIRGERKVWYAREVCNVVATD
ncbi:hypothetical protein H072_5469 [Dactylellina haptotyla CBS 200.50]|uniref:Hypercellular protein HypA n=1 Tax=Dactylellina haptotyla (strain CBS 200.50) TaxID=1284197 RepID=S8AHQ5_DACHA|nr:hypothetical protein H072_5469 [Dactylellina haptotyla CBS 200.50]